MSSKSFLLFPILAGGAGDHLLGKHIQRFLRHLQAIEFSVAETAQHGDSFDQFIPAQREKASFGQTATPVLRATDPLQKRREGMRRR